MFAHAVSSFDAAAGVPRWLDTMTYEQYLVNVMGLSPQVARYADPILAAAIGLGSDVIAAYMNGRSIRVKTRTRLSTAGALSPEETAVVALLQQGHPAH